MSRTFCNLEQSYFPNQYLPNLFPKIFEIIGPEGTRDFLHEQHQTALDLIFDSRNYQTFLLLLDLGFSPDEISLTQAISGELWLAQPTDEDKKATLLIPHVAAALFWASYQPEKVEEKIDYGLNNKQAMIDHVYGNYIKMALLTLEDKRPKKDNSELQSKYLTSLKEAKRKPDHGEVNLEVLEQLINEGQKTNWNDLLDLQKLAELVKKYKT